MSQEKPVHEIRLGKCKAAIWLNQTDSGPRYNVSFSRIYKTEKGWSPALHLVAMNCVGSQGRRHGAYLDLPTERAFRRSSIGFS